LRYPLVDDSAFGQRCPVCLGLTKLVMEEVPFGLPANDKEPLPTSVVYSVLLDNIRSALNVGSIFRSADGFGFRHLYLCGITPTPENAEVCKSAVGAEQVVEWSTHRNAVELIASLRNQCIEIWGLEKTDISIPINSAIQNREKSRPLVLIVGNEVAGVDPGILDLADRVVHIPMRGQKESLNVAVAFAVAAQIIGTENLLSGQNG
jgi:23S rRNA (guanosine2251-2'-O)-methyltransferase